MKRLRICVCTSLISNREPRAAKHAATLAKMNKRYEVIFLDCTPSGQAKFTPKMLRGFKNLYHRTYYFPYKKARIFRLLFDKFRYFLSRFLFAISGQVYSSALSIKTAPLEKILKKINADVYIGYNIDTLLPVYRVAKKKGTLMIFDCYDFYSGMGHRQIPLEQRIIRRIESRCLPYCDLVLTTSDRLADKLVNLYGIKRPLTLYNTPSLQEYLSAKDNLEFTLYWRNIVINLGQRGLDDVLIALTVLPEEITLHLQGNLYFDGGKALRKRIKELKLVERVVIHPPYLPHKAVTEASKYTIGLCLEKKGIPNHDLTISNKIFDYFMAGLAVIASDLPPLRDVITRSGGGLLFKSGSPEDLADKIMMLYKDRALLKELAANARSFALREGNLEYEMKKFVSAFSVLLDSKNE